MAARQDGCTGPQAWVGPTRLDSVSLSGLVGLDEVRLDIDGWVLGASRHASRAGCLSTS